ncbi:MAG TPA: M1 family aminopeptidase [Pyrinomonadaceae bacterium]|nr:M1 family aminopeptidase [Pyrinomonadaceae bacterium]
MTRTGIRAPAALALALAGFALAGLVNVGGAAAGALASSARQSGAAKGAAKAAAPDATRYDISLDLDFDARRFAGTQRVNWVNRAERPASVLYFHLYPNLRPEPARGESRQEPAAGGEDDEPRLEVTRAAQAGRPLDTTVEDGGVTLKVQLREAVPPGASTEVELAFRGTVPVIDPDETSLSAHVVQQVGAALRDTREVRRARDTNFVSRGVMLLGGFHPVLAPRARGEWRRKLELTVGDTLFADVADYDVRVSAADGLALYAPAAPSREPAAAAPSREPTAAAPPHEPAAAAASGGASGAVAVELRARRFGGQNLRGFSLLAGRSLRSAEAEVGGLTVRSVYAAEHERVGRRVLGVATEAARVYAARFGRPPFNHLTVAEAPLVAGLGSTEFAGLAVVASAFYLDFDSPAARSLPEIVREQRSSVEDSLEFAVAQGVAHQWWGAGVGTDPAREPVLDEGLAHWSALLYVREAHGEERARVAEEDQLRGVYQLYRTFGGEDMAADRPAREYRNSLQYAAVVASKGALMLVSLRQLLGDESFFRALRSFYEAHRLGFADLSDLRAAFAAAAADAQQRRAVARHFDRWLGERRGDEDIGPPNSQLAGALGVAVERADPDRDRNAFSRLGRFFWRQMTRIR